MTDAPDLDAVERRLTDIANQDDITGDEVYELLPAAWLAYRQVRTCRVSLGHASSKVKNGECLLCAPARAALAAIMGEQHG